MRDEKDGFAFRSEILHDLHQLVDLLRRENCRRLVEDQDFIVAVEHFENFGSLLHADGNILDLRVRIDAQTVALRQGDDLLARLLLLQEARLVRLHAENDIVQHREALDQLEVLVNHADVEVVGVVGVADFDDLSVLFNDAALRLIEPKEHAHQRRLAGTVFAEQRVDFPSLELEGDVVIGADAGKFLRDIQHLNDIFRFRQFISLLCLPQKPFAAGKLPSAREKPAQRIDNFIIQDTHGNFHRTSGVFLVGSAKRNLFFCEKQPGTGKVRFRVKFGIRMQLFRAASFSAPQWAHGPVPSCRGRGW